MARRTIINPILKKDILVNARSARMVVTITVINCLFALVVGMLFMTSRGSAYQVYYSNIAQMFPVLAVCELCIIGLIVPIITSTSISGERERQTLEIMLTTPVRPISIVAGKLLSAVATTAMYVIATLPFMAVAYFVFALILIICNITKVPAAVVTVVQGAFHPRAVTGGVVGSMFVAMQNGVARGIFSNEAGLGSAPIAAAAAQTHEPVRQGLVSMTGTFIDTIVICTLTGLSIVLTGAWQVDGLEGVQVTTYAFQNGLPFPHVVSSFVLMMCLVFFAFTTILGWDYYSERCLEYLTGGNMKKVMVFRWIYILAVFIGPYMTVSAVWTIADIFNGLMALPNMIALFALNGVVVYETKKFFEAGKHKK